MESSASAGRVPSAVLVRPDLFGMTYTDLAATVGRTAAAVRQLAARGRARTEERTPLVPVDAAADAAEVPIVGRSRSPAHCTESHPRTGQARNSPRSGQT